MSTFKSIDRSVQQGLGQQPVGGKIAQVLSIFATIKPILTELASVKLIPESWRVTIKKFVAALDGVNADFKAGKDL